MPTPSTRRTSARRRLPSCCSRPVDTSTSGQQDAVTFTHSASGVVAGLAAGMTVIGVGQDSDAELLRDYGARRIIPSLSTLLPSSLTGGDAM